MHMKTLAIVLAASIPLLGCGTTSNANRAETYKKQIVGTWYTANKTGRVLVFTDDGRVLMFATATRGTFFDNSTYSDGGVGFDISADGPTDVIKFTKRDPSRSGDADEEFKLVSLEGDTMVLERTTKNQTGKQTTLKRLDPAPLSADAVLKRLPADGYLFVPPGADSMNVDDF
jgi:hypothetical protein